MYQLFTTVHLNKLDLYNFRQIIPIVLILLILLNFTTAKSELHLSCLLTNLAKTILQEIAIIFNKNSNFCSYFFMVNIFTIYYIVLNEHFHYLLFTYWIIFFIFDFHIFVVRVISIISLLFIIFNFCLNIFIILLIYNFNWFLVVKEPYIFYCLFP